LTDGLKSLLGISIFQQFARENSKQRKLVYGYKRNIATIVVTITPITTGIKLRLASSNGSTLQIANHFFVRGVIEVRTLAGSVDSAEPVCTSKLLIEIIIEMIKIVGSSSVMA